MIERPAHNVIMLFAVSGMMIILYASVKRIAYKGKALVCLLHASEPIDLNKDSFFSSHPILQVDHHKDFTQAPSIHKLQGQRYRVLHYSHSGKIFTLSRVQINSTAEIS